MIRYPEWIDQLSRPMNETVMALPPIENSGAERPERIVYPNNPRYRRIRFLSVLMDQSIVLPNGYRIGLDPLMGLLPGIGDALTAVVSCYLVYESARLGLRKRVLLRMLGNIALDAAVGSIPVLGDFFDAAWKSNMRNLRLLDQHYHPAMPERSPLRLAGWMAGVTALLLVVIGMLFFLTAQLILMVVAAVTSLIRP